MDLIEATIRCQKAEKRVLIQAKIVDVTLKDVGNDEI